MQPVDLVNNYYLKFGIDEKECAKEYNKNNKIENINRKIKKIAIYYSVMNRGGVQRVISLMLPLYKQMGYEIVLITETISSDDYDVPTFVKRYIVSSIKDIKDGKCSYKKRAEDFEKIFVKEQIDAFIHHGVRNSFFVYDILLANNMGIHTIAIKHQVFTQGFCDINDMFFLHKNVFETLNKLIVLSSVEETYWKSIGINANYIENPYNIFLSDIKQETENENVVWVGRLDANAKQYLDIIEIAKKVIEKKPSVQFLIYGSGSNHIVKEFECQVYNNNIEKNIKFCGYESDVTNIYKNARIHLVTSIYEAFPMGIYESRICGIPLVMYELPYLELLKEKKGFLASTNGDIVEMAENICKILDNPELENKLRNEAKESLKKFSNDIVCEKWKNVFDDIENNHKEKYINEEMKLIIETMHKHFAIAQRKYEKLSWITEQEKTVYHIKKHLERDKKIVICPYGNIGKKVKRMLNEKGIQETYIVDNILSKYDNAIMSMDEIKNMNVSEMCFIICSEQEDIKRMFYDNIKNIAGAENILFYDESII